VHQDFLCVVKLVQILHLHRFNSCLNSVNFYFEKLFPAT
jgi:hypothetical protein